MGSQSENTPARATRLLPWTSPGSSDGARAIQSLCVWTTHLMTACCQEDVPAIGLTMAGFIGRSNCSSRQKPLWSGLISKRFLISQTTKEISQSAHTYEMPVQNVGAD